MAWHVFHDICLHVTWHAKDNVPLLKGDVERKVHEFLRRRRIETKGVFLHGISGTENRVHVVLSIEPFVNISDFIGGLKGASAREINKQKGAKALGWQRGFGVVSFGRKNLPFVVHYVSNQKEHHAKGTIHEGLERTSSNVDDG